MQVSNELVYLDLAGNPLDVGFFIVYAATWGRSSVLKYGIITRRTSSQPCNYQARINTPKIGVITVDRCPYKGNTNWEVQKNGQEQILGYLDRMLAIDSNQIPTGAKVALCNAYEKWHQPKIKANGGGHGQGNGTAGRKFYPCWACGGHPLKCGGGSMCARKQGLA